LFAGEVELPLHYGATVPFISHYWIVSQLSCILQTGLTAGSACHGWCAAAEGGSHRSASLQHQLHGLLNRVVLCISPGASINTTDTSTPLTPAVCSYCCRDCSCAAAGSWGWRRQAGWEGEGLLYWVKQTACSLLRHTTVHHTSRYCILHLP